MYNKLFDAYVWKVLHYSASFISAFYFVKVNSATCDTSSSQSSSSVASTGKHCKILHTKKC